MCGILGISYPSIMEESILQQIVHDLFTLSETRGKEAVGIGSLYNKRLDVLRIPEKATTFIKLDQFENLVKKLTPPNASSNGWSVILGNTRLATNGTTMNPSNNQPVVTSQSIGIHNGMIINDLALWKKFKLIHREYEVDTEVFLKLMELFIKKSSSIEQSVCEVYRQIEGAVSIAVMNCYFEKIILATNTGSLYYVFEDKYFLFASEEFILSETCKSLPSFRADSIKHLLPGNALSFDYKRGELFPFRLNKYKPRHDTAIKTKLFSIHVKDLENISLYRQTGMNENKLKDLQNHYPDVRKIDNIRRCAKCILPETMPLIFFDREGVCNFCKSTKKIHYAGVDAFIKILEKYKSSTDVADCIVPLSGGRDSSYGLHFMKKIMGMNPIAYTYDWGMVTDIARRNQYRLTAELGVEHIIVSADINKKRENIRKNVEAWLKRPNLAMVPLFMAGDKQAEYFAEKVRHQTKRNLMVYCRGNELEDERFKFGYYGIFDGTPGGVIHNLSWGGKMQMATYYAREYLLNPAYINSSLYDTAFAYFSSYMMPHEFFLYLWHFVPWDEKEIITTLKKMYGWESPSDTIATWRIDDGTPPFYNYIYYTVQGFTEHDGLRSNQIRQGVLTRKEALRLVREENKPRYEALKWYFDVTKIDGDKALSIIDRIPKKY